MPFFIVILPFSPVFQGCMLICLPKQLTKITACAKAAHTGNLRNRFLSLSQHLTRSLQPTAAYIFIWCHMQIFLKQPKAGSSAD